MVAALELYCDLLDEPGVLNAPFRHYAGELRRVGAANRRLLEGLSQLDGASWQGNPGEAMIPPPQPGRGPAALSPMARLRARWQPDRKGPEQIASEQIAKEQTAKDRGSSASQPPGSDVAISRWPASLARSGDRQALASEHTVENLAEELQANRNLLGAMVGHAVTLGLSIRGGARPIAMTGDDLTRVLVNLARNAAEAMPGGGHLQISLEEGPEFLTLSFTDNGPGIPPHALESIFSPGYSTHVGLDLDRDAASAWPVQHRGLGLSIVRSLVAAAGGAVWAANRMADPAGSNTGADAVRCAGHGDSSPPHGAVFLLEFPLASVNSSHRK
jgi:hypothetical protein